MKELVVKVPAPFSGVNDVGFTARHPSQEITDRLRDVPVIVEGARGPMQILVSRLTRLADKDKLLAAEGADEGYTWSPPISISDEICVMSFRDVSTAVDDPLVAERQYVWNLIRPLAFTFLRDCVRLGRLKLRDEFDVILSGDDAEQIDLTVRLRDIVADNGTDLLYVA